MCYNAENQAVFNVCLKTLGQFDELANLSKQHMMRICKILKRDYPDLSISYKNKDITNDVAVYSTFLRTMMDSGFIYS